MGAGADESGRQKGVVDHKGGMGKTAGVERSERSAIATDKHVTRGGRIDAPKIAGSGEKGFRDGTGNPGAPIGAVGVGEIMAWTGKRVG